jgi:hypothetical protein
MPRLLLEIRGDCGTDATATWRGVERPCAHLYETGALRRAHVCGHVKLRKRLPIQASAFNVGLGMRTLLVSESRGR